MAQFGRPSADTVRTGWTNDAGGTTNIYQTIDESSASDSDYIKTATPPGSNEFESLLSSLQDPLDSTGHILRWRRRKQGAATVGLTVRLLQGTTQIATASDPNIGTSFADNSLTLSGGEADSITDYSDLRIEWVASHDTTGSPGTEGPTFTGTGDNFNDGGTTAWTNPTNIQGDTTSTAATCSPPANGDTSQRLRCTGFSFAVPTGAVINGVTVEVEQQAANNSRHRWNSVRLLVSGSETGNDNSDASAIQTTKLFKTFGSSSDGWGASLTHTIVNASDFGVSLKIDRNSAQSTTTSLFRCRITVNYTTVLGDADAEVSWAEFEIPDVPAPGTVPSLYVSRGNLRYV